MNGLKTICISRFLALLTLVVGTSACVTENMTTGEMVPRGAQTYPWDQVEERAKRLQEGMSKARVIQLMGSPAETDSAGDLWIYLPERYAILIPAQALRLEFKDGVLVEHGYRAIVLGTRL